MIFIGEMLSCWDNLWLKTITLEIEWVTYCHWRISLESWNLSKQPDIWVSCHIMVVHQNHWRETSPLWKIKCNKLVISMLTLKQGIFTSVDQSQWIIYKLRSRKTLMSIPNMRRCSRRERTTDCGCNQLSKSNHNRWECKDMHDS